MNGLPIMVQAVAYYARKKEQISMWQKPYDLKIL